MKEDAGLDKLAQMIQRGFDEVKGEITEVRGEITQVRGEITALRIDMDNGFTEVTRRLEKVVQPQLDDNVRRIKKLEEEVFPH